MTDEYMDAFAGVVVSLAAAISLLEGGGKKAAASDKMFSQMLADYRKSLEAGRAALSANSRLAAMPTMKPVIEGWTPALCEDGEEPAPLYHIILPQLEDAKREFLANYFGGDINMAEKAGWRFVKVKITINE